MRNNETGEYELVVGNKQLLSGFFIVVLLCAVAFALGYVVGENSRGVKPAEMAGGQAKGVEPRPEPGAAEAKERAPAPVPPAADPKPAEDISPPPAPEPPHPTTKAARDVEPQPPAAPPKREPPPEVKSAPETAPGQYWQVTATSNRNSAETLVQTLRDKGFPATLRTGHDNLTRVLVGPYPDTASMGKAKTDLESNGFTSLLRK